MAWGGPSYAELDDLRRVKQRKNSYKNDGASWGCEIDGGMRMPLTYRGSPVTFERVAKRSQRILHNALYADPLGAMHRRERRRLRGQPNMTLLQSTLLGRRIYLSDARRYLNTYEEIFAKQIYRFQAASATPTILDCGANIGLSVIYFKQIYPQAAITAFEPDPEIFALLTKNLASFGYYDVTLVSKAVWCDDGVQHFAPDGSLGGRLVGQTNGTGCIEVPTVRLRDYLDQPIDFLKIDIEGAEETVLADCADKLDNVEHLFVEYHGKADELQTLPHLLQILQDAGLRYYIKESWPVRQPFVRRKSSWHFDLQLDILAFRQQ
jgi:FkbM family methyltransferase